MYRASLKTNILSLSALQAANYFIPLLTIPYITRQLGLERYGEIVFAQSILQITILIVDYGFSLGGARDIAACREDKACISRKFCVTWAAQWALLLLVLALTMAFLLFNQKISNNTVLLYVVGSGLVIAQVLFPLWLFQGIERLDIAATCQIIGKVSALPILLLCEPTPNGQIAVMGFFSASMLVPGVLGLWWINKNRVVVWLLPTRTLITSTIKNGSYLFVSRISISIYTTAIPIGLGYWAGSSQLALFNLADKVRLAVQSLVSPLSQALLPRMSYLFSHEARSAFHILRKSAWILAVITLTAGACLVLFAEQILFILGGNEFLVGADVLRLLAIAPFIVATSNLLGMQIMLPLGFNKHFSVITSLASLIPIISLYWLVVSFGAFGAACAILVTESFVALIMLIFVMRILRNRPDLQGITKDL